MSRILNKLINRREASQDGCGEFKTGLGDGVKVLAPGRSVKTDILNTLLSPHFDLVLNP